MDISKLSVTHRLLIGVGLVLVGSTLGQPNLGLETRISAFATLFGIGFLGAAFEPPLTARFGASGWNDLSTTKQLLVSFVLALVAIVLFVAVQFGQIVFWGLF